MSIEMKSSLISSTGLPIYRVQFLNTETNEVISDVDVMTAADCVKYINDNPIIKEKLGFKKGESVNTDLYNLVNSILYPYYPPEFVNIHNISNLPDFGDIFNENKKIYKEKGIVVDKFTLGVEVMAGSKELVKCSLVRYQNNMRNVIETKQLNISPGESSTIEFILPKMTNDTIYFFEISDDQNTVQSSKIEYEFILPIYVGYSKDGLLDPTLNIDDINNYINGLIDLSDRVEKRLVAINSVQKAFFDVVDNDDELCPFILVPLKWNSLIKIVDANNMDITKFYGNNNNIILETNSNNTDYEGYVLYVTKRPADSLNKTRYLRDITYIFTHDMDWKDLESEGEQTEVFTGFELLTPGPIDSRFVKESFDDLAYISKPYEGLVVYIKNINTYYKYNSFGAWEVIHNSVRLYSGKPSETMGGKLDISIDIATGDIYQKTNSNIWDLKGNIRTGVTY